MKLLLDTHVWLWWNTEPERLAPGTRRQIENPRNAVFLSPFSNGQLKTSKTELSAM